MVVNVKQRKVRENSGEFSPSGGWSGHFDENSFNNPWRNNDLGHRTRVRNGIRWRVIVVVTTSEGGGTEKEVNRRSCGVCEDQRVGNRKRLRRRIATSRVLGQEPGGETGVTTANSRVVIGPNL